MRLGLGRPTSYAREDFVVSGCNATALNLLDAWPAWPGGRLALVGPAGAGKTHLARAWAAKVGAVVLGVGVTDVSLLRGRPVLLEDVDRCAADDALFQIINMADPGTTLLVTGRTEPTLWPARLADMRSRLNALFVAKIEAPDDVVLSAVMVKLFRERNIRPSEDVLAYLLNRIERSIPAAREVVHRIDDVADAERREITRVLARQILENEEKTLDLFE